MLLLHYIVFKFLTLLTCRISTFTQRQIPEIINVFDFFAYRRPIIVLYRKIQNVIRQKAGK